MIKAYSYIATNHNKLHEFVLAYFSRIEFETGEYNNSFFDADFYNNIVKRHPGILKTPFIFIYNTIKNWSQEARTNFCNGIKNSNEIKQICEGTLRATKITDILPIQFQIVVEKLFKDLYTTVLSHKNFTTLYGDRQSHFKKFRQHKNNDFSFCPTCGIERMKTYEERPNQYDHYLPKNVYPFSSINFQNLVPICTDCNSILEKGATDILSFNGVAFYPYDNKHNGIDIELTITKQHDDVSKIEWEISYSNKDGKNNEVIAWQKTYNIDTRHKKYLSGSIRSWYNYYEEYLNDKDIVAETPVLKQRATQYIKTLKKDTTIHQKAINTIIDEFDLSAREEAEKYSRFN
jgi:hypothetical protein